MKAKASYKGIPASHHAAVRVFQASCRALGTNYTPRQAWAELQARAKATKQAQAARDDQRKAERKAKLVTASAELLKHAKRLNGVSDILRAIDAEAGEMADAAGLAREAVDEANTYISELSGVL